MTAVRAAVDGDVLVVTIDRPEARNAVNLEVAEGIAAAIDQLDGDDALRAGILTGAGGTFCAGMDLKAFVAGERPYVGERGFAGLVQQPPRKPLIAAVEGWALAGGFEIALACDVIVAARDARFGIPEVKRGLVAAAGGLLRLPRRIPYHLAMELALTGEPIGAERAYDDRDRLPARRAGRGGRRGARAGRHDRPQRPAGGRRDEADRQRCARLAGGRGVGPAGHDRRRGLRAPRMRARARGPSRRSAIPCGAGGSSKVNPAGWGGGGSRPVRGAWRLYRAYRGERARRVGPATPPTDTPRLPHLAQRRLA